MIKPLSNYPPGTWAGDPNAPWNQPDAPEPTDAEIDKAKDEIWPFLDWCESATLDDIYNAAEKLNTDESYAAYDNAEACGKPNPIGAIDDALRKTIDAQASDWVDERAQTLADEVDWDYERECAHADDERKRRQEEGM